MTFQLVRANIGGRCKSNLQCSGTEFADVCHHGVCVCRSGYIQIDRKCYQGKHFNVIIMRTILSKQGQFQLKRVRTQYVHIYLGHW